MLKWAKMGFMGYLNGNSSSNMFFSGKISSCSMVNKIQYALITDISDYT